MKLEDHNICLKATAEDILTKWVTVEHYVPNENGHHLSFVTPEEKESDDFNKTALKKLNEHNEKKVIEFAIRDYCQRYRKNKTILHVLKDFVAPDIWDSKLKK